MRTSSRRKSTRPKGLSREVLLRAMFALRYRVRDLIKTRRHPDLRTELKEEIRALRELSQCYAATRLAQEERRAA